MIFIVAKVICVAGAGFFAIQFSAAPDRLTASNLDIGEVYLEDKQITWKVRLTNREVQVQTITAFATSCACLKVEPKSIVLAKGESKDIELCIDLTGLSPPADGSARAFVASLVPVSNQIPLDFRGWLVTGKIKRLFLVDPPSCYFGEPRLNETIAPLKLTIRANAPVKRIWAECDAMTGSINNGELQASFSSILFSPNPISIPGHAQISFEVFAEDISGKVRHGTYMASGTILDEIELAPNRLLLGARPIGDSVRMTMSIRMRDGGPKITSVDVMSSSSSIAGISASDDLGVNLIVQIPIEKKGAANDSLKLSIGIAGRDSPLIRTVDVVYHGL